jgi:dinuclear metal center YbgI/SA1388 family protein
VNVAQLADIVGHLDGLLRTVDVPDYDFALNGLQLGNSGRVTRVAAAVDFCLASVRGAVEVKADLLIVHHGMFWGGLQRIEGSVYDRYRELFAHGIAVYSSHIPLDLHPTHGNNVLLARELELTPEFPFARFQEIQIGVGGTAAIATRVLAQRATAFAERWGGTARTTPIDPGRMTRRWAICSGAGASTSTLQEARALGVDTLIVGEGPHHTAVQAAELGIAMIYAGHYATETLGVASIAAHIAREFDVVYSVISAPTGL